MRKLAFLALVSTGFAVLPPYYQSVKEIQTLTVHPRLCQLLAPGEVIMNIERTERGYQIRTQNYIMDVDIHYGGDERIIGPAQFQFEFFEATDIRLGEASRVPSNKP